MVEPTAEAFDILLEEFIANEAIRLSEVVWRTCQKRAPFAKDDKDGVDWFCLAMGMPTAYENEGLEVWLQKRQ